MLLFIMQYLADELLVVRSMPCEVRARQLGEVFRMDAKAEGDTVVIGGWCSQGGRRTVDAAWFSVQLTRSTAPWAFARGEPFRTIASLELLGSLVGLMILVPPEVPRGETSAVMSLSCGTDNQGNTHLLDRMLTTKYPLGIVLMELAHQMRKRNLVLRAHWLPRLENEEADALTNFDYRHFRKENRIAVEIGNMGFEVMDKLFKLGEEYLTKLEAEKARRKQEGGQAGKKKKKGLIGNRLADRERW